MALYRRYRPERFQDVIGQEQVTRPLMAALRNDRTVHAYLFSGPRGCGKTTSARILARCLNCAKGPTDTPCGECDSCRELANGGPGSIDVVEMDAASHGGVDDARDLVERAAFAPARDRYKIFIIDEAHMVSNQGFNALLKLVEEPPEHVKFIFATTEPDKVIGTIRSRTHHYPFRLVPPATMGSYLASICAHEGVDVEPGVLDLVVRAGGGSVRDSLSVLDQLMGGSEGSTLQYGAAVALLGYTDTALLDATIDAISQENGASLFGVVESVVQSGHDPRRFVEDLLQRMRDLVLIALAGEAAADAFAGYPADHVARMREQAAALGAERANYSANLANEALNNMVGATSPRLQLELLCARLLLPGFEHGGTSVGSGTTSVPGRGGADGHGGERSQQIPASRAERPPRPAAARRIEGDEAARRHAAQQAMGTGAGNSARSVPPTVQASPSGTGAGRTATVAGSDTAEPKAGGQPVTRQADVAPRATPNRAAAGQLSAEQFSAEQPSEAVAGQPFAGQSTARQPMAGQPGTGQSPQSSLSQTTTRQAAAADQPAVAQVRRGPAVGAPRIADDVHGESASGNAEGSRSFTHGGSRSANTQTVSTGDASGRPTMTGSAADSIQSAPAPQQAQRAEYSTANLTLTTSADEQPQIAAGATGTDRSRTVPASGDSAQQVAAGNEPTDGEHALRKIQAIWDTVPSNALLRGVLNGVRPVDVHDHLITLAFPEESGAFNAMKQPSMRGRVEARIRDVTGQAFTVEAVRAGDVPSRGVSGPRENDVDGRPSGGRTVSDAAGASGSEAKVGPAREEEGIPDTTNTAAIGRGGDEAPGRESDTVASQAQAANTRGVTETIGVAHTSGTAKPAGKAVSTPVAPAPHVRTPNAAEPAAQTSEVIERPAVDQTGPEGAVSEGMGGATSSDDTFFARQLPMPPRPDGFTPIHIPHRPRPEQQATVHTTDFAARLRDHGIDVPVDADYIPEEPPTEEDFAHEEEQVTAEDPTIEESGGIGVDVVVEKLHGTVIEENERQEGN
ncbi:DNA polymerase III subunit gamma and tau [Neoactinobaculum massilliense]|uniref:DNA polymerase III subunit gamma and tau n=1 Tax=Neoactinobaculum massilliense TaxID=2364794 RepID=UPI000F533F96